MVRNIKELLNKAKTAENVPVAIKSTSSGSSKPSFGIVYSSDNGKRLSFSKALVKRLGLEDTVSILPIIEDGIVLIGKEFDSDNASVGRLSKEGKKYCYNAAIVKMLIDAFELDFSSHVSRSYDDISFEYVDDKMVAAVKIQ